MLPDICGWLEYPDMKVGERYIFWYDKYLKKKYSGFGGEFNDNQEYIYDEDESKLIVLLSGQDCYALRCAYLHNGVDEITGQRIRDSINQFIFINPPKPGETSKHLVKTMYYVEGSEEVLQLEVDKFCEDICCGVDEWEVDVTSKNEIQQRLGQLLKIHEN